ncbi:MAG: glycosyltransferase family 39 protein [Candidatus Omnitrophica bacterium]|nr:glycosyltransferase family 39 protein [Candidatus Omnitrophota bacterium]
MISRIRKIDPFLLIITPVLLFLIFWNLGNQYLWHDEVQTAVLSESVLEYGYPRALIGNFLVVTDETYGIGNSYVAQPWLQNYLCALSFLAFGESNISARVLFALFGLFSFYLIYALGYRLFQNKLIARLSVVIAATCVPFLLHLRQSRYYSLTIFFTLLILIVYFRFREKRRYSSLLFIMSSFLLFQANYGCFIPVLGSLFIHFFFIEKNRSLFKKFTTLYIWIFCLTLPWAFIYKIWEQGGGFTFQALFHNAKFYLSKINAYFFPYRVLIVILAGIFIFRRKLKFSLKDRDKRSLVFLSFVIILNWIFLWFADADMVRYLIHVVALFFIIEAFLLVKVLNWNKVIGVILILALCLTNLLNTSLFYVILKPVATPMLKVRDWASDKGIMSQEVGEKIGKELGKISKKAEIKSYFFSFLYEITHDYDGPIEGVVKYLKHNAKPDDTIKTGIFNRNHLFFYTDLNIDSDFTKEDYPEWIFVRSYWTSDAFYETAYFKKIKEKYEKIDLNYPDIRWENRPGDMSFHYFKTAPLEKKITLYRRKG